MPVHKQKYTLPLVDIVAVCYNHANYLTQTLNSIIEQTYPNINLIIVDDCSQDNSATLIADWIKNTHSDCTFIRHAINRGLCPTLNEALNYCKGEYIQFIACDDILLPNKIEIQIELFSRLDTDTGFIYTDMEYIDKDNRNLGITSFKLSFGNTQFQPPKGHIYHNLLENYFIPTPSILWNSKVFSTLGGFDEQLYMEDLDYVIRASQRFKAEYINRITVKYRYLESSISHSNNPKFILSHLLSYEKHLNSDRRARHLAMSQIAKHSIHAYQLKVPKISKWLLYKFLHEKNISSLLYFILYIIGIDHPTVSKILKKINNKFNLYTLL